MGKLHYIDADGVEQLVVNESDFDATTFLYATSDNTPQVKTPAEVLAILSGESGATFDWNAQDLSNIKVLYVTDSSLYIYLTGVNAILNFDANDYLVYNRTANTLKVMIGGVEVADLSVDDTPVDGATTAPISSNWAYDHVAAADPHTGYTLESLFDANTILAADTDNTPAALTVTEQTIVGRITSGNIAALTATQLATLLSTVSPDIPVVSKTGAYTMTGSDCMVLCDASGAAFTITLPAASGITGRVYIIKKTNSCANAVTVDGNASETIDGSTTAIINLQYESITIICDGSNWYII